MEATKIEQIDKHSENNAVYNKMYESVISGKNILLSGAGGCGKSWSIRRLVTDLIELGKNVFVTATTGVAAVNLSSGSDIKVSTVHKFAGVGQATLDVKPLISKVKKSLAAKNWIECDILVIDEVSMLGGSFFQKLDTIAKTLRNNNLPFGGIQLIMSGDFMQLSPVKDIWVFLTDEWDKLELVPFILETPYRYDDMKFFEMLLRIRMGELTIQDSEILQARVKANRKMHELLAELTTQHNVGEIIRPTMFYSKKCDVELFNKQELDKLPGELISFKAKDEFIRLKTLTIEDYTKILDDDMPSSVSFKVGAQVMLRINLDVDQGLVNGSRGVVSLIVPGEALVVKFLNGKKVRVDLHARKYEDKNATVVRIQIPFVLAYAVSIHKAQGCTCDYAIIDIGDSIFSDGQAYVALSRCRNIEGLFISKFAPSKIKANFEAVEYDRKIKLLSRQSNYVKIVNDNILNSKEHFIAHQCNCTSTNAQTLAKQIFEKYPLANSYKNRIKNDKSTYSEPGSIEIYDNIINMYAQVYPSTAKYNNDLPEMRIRWFEECLDKISKIEKLLITKNKTIAMPYNIGCGAAGGDWNIYYKIINDFADKHNIYITFYKFDV